MAGRRTDATTAKGAARAKGAPSAGRRIRGLDAEQRKEQRRAQLHDAALELFAANGYQETSIEQICQVAYVGTKSFYELFDSREACYISLLQRITDQLMARIAEQLRTAPEAEADASRMLIGAFAHSLVDDPRLAKVTFGEGGAISPAVERQRRANRRRAAALLETIWQQYGVTAETKSSGSRRRSGPRAVAVGVIGGMFELVADWLQGADPSNAADVESLVANLTDFYETVRRGLNGPGR